MFGRLGQSKGHELKLPVYLQNVTQVLPCLVLDQGCEIHCDIESTITELPEQWDSIMPKAS